MFIDLWNHFLQSLACIYIFWLQRTFVVADKIEKTAEVAIEVINTVAEATEKVTGEVANAFLGNENLKEAASRIKTVMDAIEEDAEKAEALIEKVSLVTQSIFLSEEKTWDIANTRVLITAAASVATT